jgi:hypothetical protein
MDIAQPDPAIAETQHGAPTGESRQRVAARIEYVAMPIATKHRVRRRDQIARRVRQRPVEIEYNRCHRAPPPLFTTVT